MNQVTTPLAEAAGFGLEEQPAACLDVTSAPAMSAGGDGSGALTIRVIPAARLSGDQLAAWSRLQQSNPSLANPFFRPEFTLGVAAERDGVEVAIWERAGEPVGFLPFERSRRGRGRAVGYYINQYQGAITGPGLVWSPQAVVRAAGLRSWQFDHLGTDQRPLASYGYIEGRSCYLDLSQGFEHYRKSRGKSASTFVSHVMQKDRKAGRDLGEIRVEVNPAGGEAFERLLQWKIDQSRRTRIPCVFDMAWVIGLHKRLLGCASEDFAGMFFSLHMGGRLAAGFFCLRSGSVLQGSVLGYDRELGQFAPGLVLLMRVAQMAPSLGLTRIDMGGGAESYKEKIASGFDQVFEGAVSARPGWQPLWRNMYRAKNWLRATRLRPPLRPRVPGSWRPAYG